MQLLISLIEILDVLFGVVLERILSLEVLFVLLHSKFKLFGDVDAHSFDVELTSITLRKVRLFQFGDDGYDA